MGWCDWIFGEELPKEDSQLECGLQVASYGDSLLEESFLRSEPAGDDGLKGRRISSVSYCQFLLQSAPNLD